MEAKASILIAIVLFSSVFAEENYQPEPKHDTAGGDSGRGGGGAGRYSAGFSHGGVYGGGQICKWGCCSESYGYSHTGGGYYTCTCCATPAEAKAYKESLPKAGSKN